MVQHKARPGSVHAPTQRQLKVGEAIRHALSDIFMRGDLHDLELSAFSITVSEVRISPDLKNATAYVAPLGGSGGPLLLEALDRVSNALRHLVTSRVNLRYSPRLSFRLDQSFDNAAHIDALLRRPEVARDLQREADEAAAAAAALTAGDFDKSAS